MVQLGFLPSVGEKLKKDDAPHPPPRNSALESRTVRTRLRIRRRPYFAKITKGLRLRYYRGSVSGSWIVRAYRGGGVYATEALAIADDTMEAALNRAFHADRVSSDSAWRKVKPFGKVDEAAVRYLTVIEARQLVATCPSRSATAPPPHVGRL